MKRVSIAFLVSGLFSVLPVGAYGQATSSADREFAPTAATAEAMRKSSYKERNETEENKTFPNQRKEQPEPTPPALPLSMTKTGKTSDRVPVSSPLRAQSKK